MNLEPLKEAFRRGTLRILGMESKTAHRNLEGLVTTGDGFGLVDDHINRMRSGESQAHDFADPSRSFLPLVRRRADGGFDFRAFYVDSSDPAEPQRAPVAAVALAGADDASRDNDPQVDESGVEPFESPCEPDTAPPDRRPPPALPARQAEPATIRTPSPPPQSTLDLSEETDDADKEEDLGLVHQLLTDYHARKLRWYEQFIEGVKDAHDPQRVLHMIAGNKETDDLWSDTPMTVGPTLSWENLPRIRVPLPFKERMYVLGRVVGIDSPNTSRIKITGEVLLTPKYADVLRKLTNNPSKVMTPLLDSNDLSHRLLLYWNRGRVRFKIRLSRGLAIQSLESAVIEDAYLEDITDEQIEEQVEWTAEALRRRPPDEPEWRARSV